MNKKGFTLYEVLCTIAILAMIFLIAMPIMSNIMRTAKLGIYKESINGYVRAINNQVNAGGYELNNGNRIKVPTSLTLESGVNDVELGKIEINGTLPDYVLLTFDASKTNVVSGSFCLDDKSFDYTSNGGVIESSNNYCTVLPGGLYDPEDNLVASWDDLINTYGMINQDYTNNESSETDYDKVETSGLYVLNTTALQSGVKLVIPEGVEYIGENMFRGVSSLQTVVFPKSLKTLGNYAFRNDNFTGSLVNIIFPYNSKLETIGRTEFLGNKGIKEVFIPSSVITIGGNAFRGMNLTNQAMGVEHVTFGPNSRLETIGDGAFGSNINLKEINLPSSLKLIDDYAFQYCLSLTELTIPASVTKIGARAFEGWIPDTTYLDGYLMNIKTITFESGSNLEYIGENAFYYNESIRSISIPSKVKVIGPKAFALPKLTSITFENTTDWYYTDSESATSGTSLDVSNPTTNANNFKSIVYSKWIKRN